MEVGVEDKIVVSRILINAFAREASPDDIRSGMQGARAAPPLVSCSPLHPIRASKLVQLTPYEQGVKEAVPLEPLAFVVIHVYDDKPHPSEPNQ